MFADRDRLVFRYEVNGRAVFADPLALRRRLIQATGGEFNTLLAEAQPATGGESDPAGEVGRENARERVLGAVYQAFGLTPVDPETGGGVTEEEAAAVLTAYLAWLEKNWNGGGN